MTNSQKIELANQVLQFSKGLSLIVSSLSFYTEKSRILLYIMNHGEGTKGSFSYSLDDESFELNAFSEAFAYHSDAFVYPSEENKILPQKIEVNEYEGCIIGFDIIKKALTNIVHICEENKELETEILNFDPSSLNYEDFDTTYNPFKKIGVNELKRRFESFYESYLGDVRVVIGFEVFIEIENKIKNYLINDTESFEIVPQV